MKHKAKIFILIFSIICLYGCTVKKAQATDTPAPGTTKSVVASNSIEKSNKANVTSMTKDFFTKESSSAVKLLSEVAASAVWQYGKELGWVDEHGKKDSSITPRQLALSSRTCNQTLIYWCWENPLNTNLPDDKREPLYSQVLFPGIRVNELPKTDEFSDWSQGVSVLTKVDAARALFSTASVDGKVGYVIVRTLYENKNGEFEDFYRVEWEANKPSDGNNSFQYKLTGVRPMEKFLLGGQPYEEFSEKYLGQISAEILKKIGITHPIGSLEKQGAWGADNTIVIKTISSQGAEELITYILVDDNGENITYLAALDEAYNTRSVQKQILTILQAKNLLYKKHIDTGLFYPGELNKWKGKALCYGFTYSDGENHRYAWVNSVTGEVELADEVEDYTRTGE